MSWDKYFPDKEYLFHVFTRFAYQIGGETAVTAMPAVFASFIVFILLLASFWLAKASLPAVFLSAAVMIASPYFLSRLCMLRPHLLAIFLFSALMWSLLRRWPLLTLFLCTAFTLSYHAIYIPMVVLAVFFSITIKNRSGWKNNKTLFYGLFGLIAGTLVNPYFPSNILMGLRHLKIALFESTASGLNFGMELYPIPANEYLKKTLLFGLLIIAGTWQAHRLSKSPGLTPTAIHIKEKHDLSALLCITALFTALTALNPRMLEYLTPLGCFLMAAIYKGMNGKFLTVLALPLLAFQGRASYHYFTTPLSSNKTHAEQILEAVSVLPENKNALVFNCEWDATPYLFYKRPNLRFLDILDPSFLWTANREAHDSRQSLLNGMAADPYGLISSIFCMGRMPCKHKADYVICRNPGVNAQLDKSPNFRKLFPKASQYLAASPLNVYELAPSRNPAQVTSFEISKLQAFDDSVRESTQTQGYLATHPSQALKWTPYVHPDWKQGAPASSFINLFRIFSDSETSSDKAEKAYCVAVRPARAEIKRLAGAQFLGFGGGKKVRLWLDGRPLFSSVESHARPESTVALIKLSRPLLKNSRIEGIVCSSTSSSFMGFALSFWKKPALDSVCSWKGWRENSELKDGKKWMVTGTTPQSCLGAILPYNNKTR